MERQALRLAFLFDPSLKKKLCLLLHRTGADAHEGVERTKAQEAGQDKYTAQTKEYIGQGACDDIGEEQYCYNNGDQDPDAFVNISHVLFHDAPIDVCDTNA